MANFGINQKNSNPWWFWLIIMLVAVAILIFSIKIGNNNNREDTVFINKLSDSTTIYKDPVA